MTTAYPGALDNFSNPGPSSSQSGGPRTHSQQHGDLNDAVEALQAHVGITGTALAGEVSRGLQAKLRDWVSVKDFGAKGDGVTDDTVAFKAALSSVSAMVSVRGATIHIPKGHYILTDSLIFNSYVADNAMNLAFSGDGFLSTWLDFSAMTGNKDGIIIVGDQQLSLSGFYLKGGAGVRDGIHLGRNLADGGANNYGASVFDLSDIRVQSCSRDGVHHYNSYMGTVSRVYCVTNGRDGFHGSGFHTSLLHQNCYALDNVACGFNFTGMVYSAFVSCAADTNQFGYALSNAHGVCFKSCGAEGNEQDGWYIYADQGTVDTGNPLMVQEAYDVRAVSLENCCGYANNQINAGYAGLARLVANNVHTGAGTFGDGSAHTVEVDIQNCDASNLPSGTKAIVTQQSLGGQVNYTERGRNFFPGGRTLGANTRRRDESLIGKSCTVSRTAVQSIPTTVDTDVSWQQADDDIGGCWVIGAPTLITIPAALNGCKIVVKIQAGWAGDNTGARYAKVFKNGAYALPMPRVEVGEADFYNATAAAASPPIRVATGDTFKLVVQHNLPGALNFANSMSYLSIEVVG